MEERWRTRDEVRVPRIEYRLSADLSAVASAKAEALAKMEATAKAEASSLITQT